MRSRIPSILASFYDSFSARRIRRANLKNALTIFSNPFNSFQEQRSTVNVGEPSLSWEVVGAAGLRSD